MDWRWGRLSQQRKCRVHQVVRCRPKHGKKLGQQRRRSSRYPLAQLRLSRLPYLPECEQIERVRAESLHCITFSAVDPGHCLGERDPVDAVRKRQLSSLRPAVDENLAGQSVGIAIIPERLRRQAGGGKLLLPAELAAAARLAGVGKHLYDGVGAIAAAHAPKQIVAPLPLIRDRHLLTEKAAGGGAGEIAVNGLGPYAHGVSVDHTFRKFRNRSCPYCVRMLSG